MPNTPPSHDAIGTAPAPWRQLVLVCGKCMKRQDRDTLRGDLKRALRRAGVRDVRVAVVGCLDLCPDAGVTLALGPEIGRAVPGLRVLSNDAPVETLLPLLAPP